MRARLPFAAALACALAVAPPRARASGDGPEDALAHLDDAAWLARREAVDALERQGLSALSAARAAEGGAREEAFARFVRWTETVAAVARSGSPTAARAATKVLADLEPEAEDDEAVATPAFLAARVARLLPEVVRAPGSARTESTERAARRVQSMLPAARATLLDVIDRSHDARRVAAALSLLDDDEAVARVARRHARDPALVERAARYESDDDATSPPTRVALALGLEGRLAAANRVLSPSWGEEALAPLLRSRLEAKDDGDLAADDFVAGVAGGEVAPADVRAAAAIAAREGHPRLARALGRRAVFLAPDDADARAALVAADEALGLHASARGDAGKAAPAPAAPAPEDDPAAAAVDLEIRRARPSSRLLGQIAAGRTVAGGSVPFAVDDGAIAYALPAGRVVVADLPSRDGPPRPRGAVRSVSPGSLGYPRSVAIAGTSLVVVGSDGALRAWNRPMLAETARVPGPFACACARPDGSVLLATPDGRLSTWAGRGAPAPVDRLDPLGFAPTRLHALGASRALAVGEAAAALVDLERRSIVRLSVEGADGHVVPFGAEGVLAAAGSRWRLLGLDGREKGGADAPEGATIAGIAGDPATGAVYLTFPGETVAVAVSSGEVAWTEGIEGGGDGVLAKDALFVPAGRGDEEHGGDGRIDRTIFFLRTDARPSPFPPEARRRVLDLATREARAGRGGVARALVGPLRAFVDETEWRAAEEALAAAVRGDAADGEK